MTEAMPETARDWTEAETQVLHDAVSDAPRSGKASDRWRQVAQFVPGRSARECRDRYRQSGKQQGRSDSSAAVVGAPEPLRGQSERKRPSVSAAVVVEKGPTGADVTPAAASTPIATVQTTAAPAPPTLASIANLLLKQQPASWQSSAPSDPGVANRRRQSVAALERAATVNGGGDGRGGALEAVQAGDIIFLVLPIPHLGDAASGGAAVDGPRYFHADMLGARVSFLAEVLSESEQSQREGRGGLHGGSVVRGGLLPWGFGSNKRVIPYLHRVLTDG